MAVQYTFKILSTVVIVLTSLLELCTGVTEILVNPYPARVYQNAPRDVPVLRIQAFDDVTGQAVTKLTLENDGRYFRLDPDGIVYTNKTINLLPGKEINFLVFAVVNNSDIDSTSANEKNFTLKDSGEYKHVRVIVSTMNQNPPRFNQSSYVMPVYRYGVGDVIGQLTAVDEDEEDYNRQFTIYAPGTLENQEALRYVNISTTGQIVLAKTVPDNIATLNITVVAEDGGSPRKTSTTEVKIDILMVKQPDIFCISTTTTSTSLCWKNPMPQVQFDGYDINVDGSIKESIYLPSIGHTDQQLQQISQQDESCLILNNTRIGGQYVFLVKVRSSEVWYGTESYLAFNKTATGYTFDCVKQQFLVCNYKNPCNSNGACNPGKKPENYFCECDIGWKGENCTIKDMCAFSPCKNGQCTFLQHEQYECSCPEGYFGKNCQYFNECLELPCQNHGSCTVDDSGIYSCKCLQGFSGKNCQVVDPCVPSPCTANRGSCFRLTNTDFECKCYPGYYGNLCQYRDACFTESSPCLYFGTCVPFNDTYYCVCPAGTTGLRCEKQDPCYLQPCQNKGICIPGNTGSFTCDCPEGYSGNECQHFDACHKVDCKNGKCRRDAGSTYSCDCTNGYYGNPCVHYDICLTLPCNNQGHCLSSDADNSTDEASIRPFFSCECTAGWYGTNCSYFDLCTSHPCKNGGSCSPVPPNSYTCTCLPGYRLEDCSTFDPCYNQPCKNEGKCLSVNQTNYDCECKEGFLLPDCSTIDPCHNQVRCKNGGTCVTEMSGGYRCDCPPGYLSQDCGQVVPCYINECQNGGQCRNLSQTEFRCDCSSEWIGSRCEVNANCQADKDGCICVNQRLQCLLTAGNISQRLNNLLDQTSDPSKLTVKQVIFFTHALWDLYNETILNIEYATIAFNVIGNLGRANVSVSYEAEKINNTNSRLREFLDNFTSEVNITERGEVTVPTKDFELKAMLLDTVKDYHNYTFEVELNFNKTDVTPAHNVSISLPTAVLIDINNTNISDDLRIQFIGYKRSQLFIPIEGFDHLGSSASQIISHQRVISATVKGKELYNLTEPVIIQMPKIQANINHTCVFWDTNASTWSTDGVTQFEDNNNTVICHSTHLTSFAVLMDTTPDQRFSKEHEDALTYITYIGCGISLACLLLTVLTYGLFRCLNNEKSGKILIQLSLSLILLNIIFLVGSVDVSGYSEVGCVIVALLLHYFILTAFMWMLIEAIEMYQALVTVFSKYEGYYLLKRCLAAWGIPVLIVGITAAVDIYSYHNDQVPREICFLTSRNTAAYYSALIAPCCLIIVINTVVFIMVSRVILKPKFQQQLSTDSVTITPAQIRGAFTVMFLLGITWVFGPLAISEAKIVFSYIFCICNSLQGFLIFIFRCLLNPEAKLAWIQLFKTGTLKRRRGPLKSSHSDYTSKAGDGNRFNSNSNGSGFNGQMSTKMSLTSKNGNGFHPHPHQLHTTSSWHPNLNGLKSENAGGAGEGHNFPLSSKKEGRRQSMEYSVTTKRESIPNDSMTEFQDELTQF